MKVGVIYINEYEYLILTMSLPASEVAMQGALANLQEKRPEDLQDHFRIFDVRSSHDGENGEIDIKIRSKDELMGKVIAMLNHFEQTECERDLARQKQQAR